MDEVIVPDLWCLVKYNTGEISIFSGFIGSYIDPDSWRRSSSIQIVAESESYFTVSTHTSEYRLNKNRVGMTSLMTNIMIRVEDMMKASGEPPTAEFIAETTRVFTELRSIKS